MKLWIAWLNEYTDETATSFYAVSEEAALSLTLEHFSSRAPEDTVGFTEVTRVSLEELRIARLARVDELLDEVRAERDGFELERDTNFAEVLKLREQVTKLQAFKDFTHEWLTKVGVPVNPPGRHTDAGCRIGQRLVWLFRRTVLCKADYVRHEGNAPCAKLEGHDGFHDSRPLS